MTDSTTGTLTLLFTDIEGSTELLRQAGDHYSELLDRHRAIIRAAVAEHAGTERDTQGDSFFITFETPSAAVAAALIAQRNLIAESWPDGLDVKVRMCIHLGEVTDRGEGPVGLAIHHGARIAATGHGGQILLSDAVRSAAATYPLGADVTALGSFRIRDVGSVRLYQLTTPDLPAGFPPLRAGRDVLGNLPSELSSFIGRVDDLKSLIDELGGHRLVTLIGVGGTGKTRLAVEAVRVIAESFPDGCWMVELASLSTADAVPFAFCTGLGITAPPDGQVLSHLVARLRDKQLLVMVDNCEHLLSAAADAIEQVIANCPRVTVLATSREPLMIRGEHLVPVPSLPAEEAQRLFIDRAHDEAPGLEIDEEQRLAIVELCERLDGLPLALELAASRVRAFTPVELVANLEERFRLLVGGRRSRMERHQTMRGTLDWSYDLCTAPEQAVFDRLSVFPSGFDLVAAKSVAAGDVVNELDVADIVAQLLDRSLLQRSTTADGTTRFRMLETMRAYAREHLHHQGDADEVRGRHAHYVAATITPLALRSFGPEEREVWMRLSTYLPDALAALDWCIDHQDWETALRVISDGDPADEREHQAMSRRLSQAARRTDTPPDLRYELEMIEPPDDAPDSGERDRAWRVLRAQYPLATDRLQASPFHDLVDHTVDETEVDEFLAHLERWGTALPINRLRAYWAAVRALAHSGHFQALEQPLSQLTEYVEAMHSVTATQTLHDTHGTIARVRHDWSAAAYWYGKIVKAGDGRLFDWWDIQAAWHLLTARCLCEGDVQISAGDLRDPWNGFLALQIARLRWRGATATALALHRLGNATLANRFATWVQQHEPPDTQSREQFSGLLQLVGLPAKPIEVDDDLEALIAEALAFADTLDAPAAERAPS